MIIRQYNKKSALEEIVTDAPQPNVMSRVKCSGCGTAHKERVSSSLDNLRFKYVIVRSATALPIYVLFAYLCKECEEKRQIWCEEQTGVKRGSEIELYNGKCYEKGVVDYYFDEVTGVNKRGYCMNIGLKGEMLHGKPRVKTVQASLF